MKIYVSHKRGMPDQDLFYQTLRNLNGHEFILPHVRSDEPYQTKELFQNKGCDLVLAEVSEPATGQGIELGWADAFNIPIKCIFKSGSKPAKSLGIISGTIVEYSDLNDLTTNLQQVLK